MDYYTKEEMDELLKKVRQDAIEGALVLLPGVVKNLITTFSNLKVMGEKFYNDNKDLAEHKDLLRNVMEELEGKNPNQTYERLLADTAMETRRRLGSLKQFDKANHGKPAKVEVDENLNNILGGL
jgi:hypothetical protein